MDIKRIAFALRKRGTGLREVDLAALRVQDEPRGFVFASSSFGIDEKRTLHQIKGDFTFGFFDYDQGLWLEIQIAI
ncbi:hypothetical protein D3C72_2209090 [compost metagenome]